MYRPRKVKIGTLDWPVSWHSEAEHADATHSLGATNVGGIKRISIYTSEDEIDTLNTFLHECLHAIYYDRFQGAEMNQELCVNGLTNGLLLFFKQNPKILDYIKETL